MSYELINETSIPNHALRRAVSHCCAKLRLKISHITRMKFTDRKEHGRGTCFPWIGYIIVRTEAEDKVWEQRPRQGHLIQINNRWELIVFLCAHELSHLYLYVEGVDMGRGEERWCDHRAITILNRFKLQQGILIPKWEKTNAKVS